MAITPIFSSPCELAERLPVMIADFLDIEQKLKRRFREDSVTDILVASLLSLPGNNVVVLAPPEAKTGGDFDLVVVDPISGDAVQFRIQAKRLTPHKHDWAIGSYAELAHPHNTGGQSQTLIRGVGSENRDHPALCFLHSCACLCGIGRHRVRDRACQRMGNPGTNQSNRQGEAKAAPLQATRIAPAAILSAFDDPLRTYQHAA